MKNNKAGEDLKNRPFKKPKPPLEKPKIFKSFEDFYKKEQENKSTP